ncbi:MAG: hypothetical protein K8I00_02255 [Candidatus Omnitrophica bacterium]|nr:hypothetical protein [Candidatus Omnitrophota bacterium]
MNKDKQNLYVFGYGISLIIPFILLFRRVSPVHFSHVNKGWRILAFLVLFALLLWVLTRIKDLKPVCNIWILAVQAAVLSVLWEGGGIHFVSFFLMAGAIIFFIYTLIDVEQLRPVYDGWMWMAQKINLVMTTLVLGIMYYGVFTPVALFFRAVGKDHLEQGIDSQAESYWIQRPKKKFNPEQYTKQF